MPACLKPAARIAPIFLRDSLGCICVDKLTTSYNVRQDRQTDAFRLLSTPFFLGYTLLLLPVFRRFRLKL